MSCDCEALKGEVLALREWKERVEADLSRLVRRQAATVDVLTHQVGVTDAWRRVFPPIASEPEVPG